MSETLGWTGLGNGDGGSIGSGTMEVCCCVVDFGVAKPVIEADPKGTEFENHTRIQDENQDGWFAEKPPLRKPPHRPGCGQIARWMVAATGCYLARLVGVRVEKIIVHNGINAGRSIQWSSGVSFRVIYRDLIELQYGE